MLLVIERSCGWLCNTSMSLSPVCRPVLFHLRCRWISSDSTLRDKSQRTVMTVKILIAPGIWTRATRELRSSALSIRPHCLAKKINWLMENFLAPLKKSLINSLLYPSQITGRWSPSFSSPFSIVSQECSELKSYNHITVCTYKIYILFSIVM